jgi:hypothetical protein
MARVSVMKSLNFIDGLDYMCAPRHWIVGDIERNHTISLILV